MLDGRGAPPCRFPESMLPIANADVIYRALSDGGILFSTTGEVYFGLNSVGAQVWELLPPKCQTLDELVDELALIHADVDPATIRADVVELLGELSRHGLLVARVPSDHELTAQHPHDPTERQAPNAASDR